MPSAPNMESRTIKELSWSLSNKGTWESHTNVYYKRKLVLEIETNDSALQMEENIESIIQCLLSLR